MGSLLLHLRDPVRALERVASVCRGEALIVDAVDPYLTLVHRRLPVAALDARGRPWWWKPNLAGLVRMVEAAGLSPTARPRLVYIPPGADQRRPRLRPREVASSVRALLAGPRPARDPALAAEGRSARRDPGAARRRLNRSIDPRARRTMPTISVVIPTYRRHAALARVLDLLERQDTGPDAFEAIVVTDDRDDDPEAVAGAIGNRPYGVRRLARSSPGVSAARNTGWRAAEADLVLFLGDDILPARSLLSQHLEWHRRHPEPTVGVLGRVEWASELRVTPFMRWLDQGVQFDYRTIRGQEADWWHFYTSNASVKRELLERVDGFDEGFPFGYEDLDIAKRMSDLGFRLHYDPDARAEHLHRPTVDEWRGRMAQVAGAERRFVSKYPELRPYFLTMLEASEEQSPGVARRALMRVAPALARVVPQRAPWLGPRVARLAAARWRRQLAAPFMAAWRAADGP